MASRTLAGLALFALVALSVSTVPAGAQATRSAPIPPATGTPLPGMVPNAVPSPISSLPPASQPQTLPYPAYGTPVPGVNRGVPAASIPQVISLNQAVAIAFARSPLLAQARATVEIDTAPVDLARTAVLPNISGTASTQHAYRELTGVSTGTTSGTTTGTGTGGTGTGGTGTGGTGTGTGGTGTGTGGTGTGGTGTTTTTGTTGTTTTTSTSGTTLNGVENSLTITLKQLIYDGGKVAAELRAARATQGSAIATYKRELQTVAYNVANSYYAALAAQRTTQVANETVKLNQVNANLVAAQIAAGTTARSDLLTAELPVAQARVALVQDQGAELSAQAAFVNAMGLDANTYVLPQDDGNVLAGSSGAPQVAVPTYEVAISRAYMLRPDFSAQQLAVLSAQASLRSAGLGLVPNLNGVASYGTASTDPNGGTFRNSGSIGLDLTIPIFDQGITHAQVEQARGQLDSANAAFVVERQNIQLNVKQTLVSLVSAGAAFVQTQAELANAREVLQATQAQYAAGVTTLPLLLNAEVGLTTALAAQVSAVYTLRQAEAAFLFAEGANAPA
jgi:multidrug efflux system outer membrane protein